MKLVLIPAGEFMMGSPDSDGFAMDTEKPQHRVKITKPFYLGVTEVTQKQHERVMGKNPADTFIERNMYGYGMYELKGYSQRAVNRVSWDDAEKFCERLSKKEGKTYQLPTEAQWEYACRSGSETKWCFGDSESQLKNYAWYLDNSRSTTHRVGQKKPNAWGLYDMHGNVFEWCRDWHDYYEGSPSTDPTGPSSGSLRVIRGGCWNFNAVYCRSAIRGAYLPGGENVIMGFRVSLVPAE
ncbi:MAG: formylglycine-generating enzyme family protein [Planctomycetes bacterium]|nr:formylglycine-generating enzyme family protein [Planctomycetota bacterium]